MAPKTAINSTCAAVVSAALACVGCVPNGAPMDARAPNPPVVRSARPEVLLPGTRLEIFGRGFSPPPDGITIVGLSGRFAGREFHAELPARIVDDGALALELGSAFFSALGEGEGAMTLDISVSRHRRTADVPVVSDPLRLDVDVRRAIAPRLDVVQAGELVFLADPIAVEGDAFLLGGAEGRTVAEISGCFRIDGESMCRSIPPRSVEVATDAANGRRRGHFRLEPAVVGVRPGRFEGTVSLRNEREGEPSLSSEPKPLALEMIGPVVLAVHTTRASFGRYVEIEGGGFVGDEGATTVLVIEGNVREGNGPTKPLSVVLVPEVMSGRRARYVINEDDALGKLIDVRRGGFTIEGTMAPLVTRQGEESRGEPAPFALIVTPVRQVVHVRFLPSYTESLAHFGLRALDREVRARVLEVLRRDYATINIAFTETIPSDYALYSQLDIAGPDPNGLGLLGYDNTPGKDTGNQRLYDRIGGVNAVTQENGFPGYGGVFIESLLAFSETHEAPQIEAISDPIFDEIFSELRVEGGGRAVSVSDLIPASEPIVDVEGRCPAPNARRQQIACAVHTLGTLIGTTASHEIGHSLGLADPYGTEYHDPGDAPDRLMDAARPFLERAELRGHGPALFCDEEYEYLRKILPSDEPADPTPRPTCR